jgi:predicted type IV restriction endonuclease
MGQYCRAEEHSSKGRADLIIETDDAVYCFELKVDGNGTADEAIKQIDDKGYLAPYKAGEKMLVKIGVVFDPRSHTVKEWVRG